MPSEHVSPSVRAWPNIVSHHTACSPLTAHEQTSKWAAYGFAALTGEAVGSSASSTAPSAMPHARRSLPAMSARSGSSGDAASVNESEDACTGMPASSFSGVIARPDAPRSSPSSTSDAGSVAPSTERPLVFHPPPVGPSACVQPHSRRRSGSARDFSPRAAATHERPSACGTRASARPLSRSPAQPPSASMHVRTNSRRVMVISIASHFGCGRGDRPYVVEAVQRGRFSPFSI